MVATFAQYISGITEDAQLYFMWQHELLSDVLSISDDGRNMAKSCRDKAPSRF
jgi:hypothetical protein